jgi:heme A synthase
MAQAMAQAHAAGGWIVLGAVAAFTLVALFFARFADPPAWLERARVALVLVLGMQAGLGILTYAGGKRPSESLHLLYGVAILGVLPLARAFSSEALPRPRSGVLAAAGVVTLALVWRAFATGA